MMGIVLAHAACHTTRKSLEHVDPTSTAHGEKRGSLVLPLSIEKEQLLEWLWELVPDTLFEMKPTTDMPAQVRIQKDVGLEASWRGDALWIALPLKVRLFRRMGFLTTKGEAKLRLHLHSAVRIDPDWTVHTSTTLDYIEWIEKPKFSVLGLQFSPVGIIEQYLYDRMPHWLQGFDSMMQEENPLPIYVRAVAEMLYRGIAIFDTQPGYVHLPIRDVRISRIRERNNRLYADVLLNTGLLAWTEERYVDSVSMPALLYGIQEPKGGVVKWNQPIQLSEGVVSKYVEALLTSRSDRDKTVQILGVPYIIEQVHVRFRGGKIRLVVTLRGVRNKDLARLHYSFRPKWDSKTHLWDFQSPDLQFHTTNRLIKFVWWWSKWWFRRVWNVYMERRWNTYWEEALQSAIDWERADALRLRLPLRIPSIRVQRVDGGVLELRVRAQGTGTLQSEHWELQMGSATQPLE